LWTCGLPPLRVPSNLTKRLEALTMVALAAELDWKKLSCAALLLKVAALVFAWLGRSGEQKGGRGANQIHRRRHVCQGHSGHAGRGCCEMG
jgi:hypothetical protein